MPTEIYRVSPPHILALSWVANICAVRIVDVKCGITLQDGSTIAVDSRWLRNEGTQEWDDCHLSPAWAFGDG
jgi:hypothetical protein